MAEILTPEEVDELRPPIVYPSLFGRREGLIATIDALVEALRDLYYGEAEDAGRSLERVSAWLEEGSERR